MDTLLILVVMAAAIYFAIQKLVVDQRCVNCHRPRVRGALACPHCGATYPSPAADGVGRLAALNGPLQGREFPLGLAQYEIGSQYGASLQVPDASVSARHAVIARQSGRYVLYDRHSGAGTFVNGRSVASYALRHGDRIQLGGTVLVFRLDRPRSPIAAYGSVPIPQPNWNQLGSELRSLPQPRRISGGGALLALLCFFLPWISVSCGSNIGISYSGWSLATLPQTSAASGGGSLQPLLFLVPLAALAVLWLLYRAMNDPRRVEPALRTGQFLAGGAGIVPLVLLYLALDQTRSDPRNLGLGVLINFEAGYWLTWIGFIGVLAGAWQERSTHPR